MTVHLENDYYQLVDSKGNTFYGCLLKENDVWFYEWKQGPKSLRSQVRHDAIELTGDPTYQSYWEVPVPVYAKIDWENLVLTTFAGHTLKMEYIPPSDPQ